MQTEAPPVFVPMVVTAEPPGIATTRAAKLGRERNGRIEIVVSRGRRVIVEAGIDPEALSRILDVLERR